MELLTIPDVTLEQIQDQEEIPLLDHGYVKAIAYMGDDLSPISAARMSTGNPTGVDPNKDAATRDYLYRHRHDSPFEMSVLQIEVQAPIFVAREWMRHRTQSYNEFSQRYSEALDLYYVPDASRVQSQSSTNKQGSGDTLDERVVDGFIHQVKEDQKWLRRHYKAQLDEGVARELARVNMPVSNYTKFRAQTNLRNWLHFLNLRMAPNAQYEIRVYAHAVAGIIRTLWPETFKVFEEHTLHAASLSRTEREIIQEFLQPLLPNYCELEALAASKGLNKSRIREFLTKLNLL